MVGKTLSNYKLIEVISSGGMSIVHPREVFKAAILANAASVLFMHNYYLYHPGKY